ncbi:hypothetical protein Sjap_018158 [Stephania japonica]|uniref:C2H2-type domain-containing protein n=1 Tax=Stephania japonica TaxID=461633 RepID=A0AAP0I7G5_9MAGN
MESEGGEEKQRVIFRDIRRYYCDYCGICRSKKSLIASHVLANHKDEVEEKEIDCGKGKETVEKKNICEECGASFRKPAYLKQHMRGHMLEHWIPSELQNAKEARCQILNGPVAGWGTSCEAPSSKPHFTRCLILMRLADLLTLYQDIRRKDHLTRHLLQHQAGKLFSCPMPDCKSRFSYQGNMTRHVKEHHDEDYLGSCDEKGPQQHVCQEEGCGKVFKFSSSIFLISAVKLDTIEAVCCEPDCMKVFTNGECLKAHIQACHQHITCDICGIKQPKKNFKRHMQVHEGGVSSNERIKCSYEGCQYTFVTKSNLNQHVKAVHLELRPFVCRIGGCGKKFSYRHVGSLCVHIINDIFIVNDLKGDFLESDAQFQSRRTSRGGRKRKLTSTIEMLQRKRIVPPGLTDSAFKEPSDYVAWLLSSTEDQQ